MIKVAIRITEHVAMLPIRLTLGAGDGVLNAAYQFAEDVLHVLRPVPKPAGDTWYDDDDSDYAAQLIAVADTEPSRCLHCGLLDCAGQCPTHMTITTDRPGAVS